MSGQRALVVSGDHAAFLATAMAFYSH